MLITVIGILKIASLTSQCSSPIGLSATSLSAWPNELDRASGCMHRELECLSSTPGTGEPMANQAVHPLGVGKLIPTLLGGKHAAA
jgi:hypothetical protein